jgi:ABC-type transporter Mla subunit MlaD
MSRFNFKGLSLRDKIVWITGISTAFSLILACLVLALNERLSYPKIMAGNLTDLAQVIGDNSTAALAFNDSKTAQIMLETLKGNSHIVSACLYDSKGSIFAVYNSEKASGTISPAAEPEGYEFSRGALRLFHEIQMGGQKQGTVYLESDTKEMNSRMTTYTLVTMLVLFLSIFVSFLTAVRLQRQVSDPLKNIIGNLGDSAEQMSSSSAQISTASQQLAEGASESASSLEETSSSLEEMASMTRQNADNAQRAKKLMEETQETVLRGNQCVSQTLGAMKEMNESAEKVSRILKTIEEIAFQTNLLALNAAVEAARAGEQGRGFAVVADEVRNLAQRSSSAARDTAALIEENARRASQGLKVSDEAGKALSEIVDRSKKVSHLIQEIAAASDEQSKGIQEVNGAVSQMDSITQRNSANAEELSSSSEEMSAQSKVLREMVGGLVRVLEGSAAGISRAGDETRPSLAEREAASKPAPAVKKSGKKNQVLAPRLAFASPLLAPEKMIPLSEEDLKNF